MVRQAVAIVIVSALALGRVSARTQNAPEVLVLRTYDTAGLSADEVSGAAKVVRVLLAKAAIEAEWRDCTIERSCEDQAGPRDLVIRFRNAGAAETAEELGQSYVDGRAMRGTLATVFADRVHRLAAQAGSDPGRLLGRVIGHEVGHLLLGPAHTSRGIMRARWLDVERADSRPWDWAFSSSEAARMRIALREDGDRPVASYEWAQPARSASPSESQTGNSESSRVTASSLRTLADGATSVRQPPWRLSFLNAATSSPRPRASMRASRLN
jgi:hypothetical protein